MAEEMTREKILELVEREDIKFIRLQFTDMFGGLKNVAITVHELGRALDGCFVVDTNHIAGITGGNERNLILKPDLSTFAILPWRPRNGKVARLLCDICFPDGTDHPASTRYILRRIVEGAKEMGYTCTVDPECEFFLFHTDENGVPTTLSHEKAGYLDISPVDLGENCRRDMVLTLEEMGIKVVSSHHESAPAQHEIDIQEKELCEMADDVMTLKMAVRTIAKSHGLHATFMPKPRAQVNGSGMHLNFSLFKDGKNILPGSASDLGELSEEGYYFIGGLLAHSREMALITNPVVNSYKRLVPGFEAPTELTWTKDNANSLIRIPYARGEETTIEFRGPDGASNPYLVLAVCLAAGLDGIRHGIYPTRSSTKRMNESDYRAMRIENLPENLKEAITLFEESDWIREILGKDFCLAYANEKKKEWLGYTRQVTAWELDEYLYRL